MDLRSIKAQDSVLADLIEAEGRRQVETLDFIASENHVSRAVMEAAGTILTNKYAEGYPRRRYYGGCHFADEIEQLAIDRAKALFHAEHVNVQAHSGSQANMAVYFAHLRPGDTILAMSLAHGGHLTHGAPVNFSGQLYKVVHYGVNPHTERIDMDQVRRLAEEHNPRLIVCGASAYPRIIDFQALSEIAAEVESVLMADIAHIAGLIAAGLHPDPFPWCEYVTTTTHKTLRGPRSGLIMCKESRAAALDAAVFPGMQGGPFMHIIAAKAAAFHEALQPAFKDYCTQILVNASALAEALLALGFRLCTGGTDNHLLLIDLTTYDAELTGKEAEGWLEKAGLIVNKNMIPFDKRKPGFASGIRMGTPAVTTRGLGAEHMKQIAAWINQILCSRGEESVTSRVRNEVADLGRQFPPPL